MKRHYTQKKISRSKVLE